MTTCIRHVVGSCVVGLLLCTVSLGAAARSDVADAVMRGDTAALRTLLAQHVDVNIPQADGATALHWAVYREDLATANLLIQAGANVRTANREGVTPLLLACGNGNAALVDQLVKGGADPNERLPHGETALMMASRSGNVAAMQVLLDRGADVNAKETLRGTTALMWAAAQAHSPAVQLLIARGADMSARSNPDRSSKTGKYDKAEDPRPSRKLGEQVLQAAQAANQERRRLGIPVLELEEALVAAQAAQSALSAQSTQTAVEAAIQAVQKEVAAAKAAQTTAGATQAGKKKPAEDSLSGGGLTSLVYAVRRNDLESVRLLLAAGADVNQVTSYGWSPLLVATQNRYYKLGSFLLDKGADPSFANKGGWTPLYLAVDNRNIEDGDYPVRKGDMDHLEFIKKLLDHGADVNARMIDNTEHRTAFRGQWVNEDGATAFWRASQSGDLVVMRLLLAHGADPKIATRINVTALQVAAGIGWVDGLTYEWSAEANLEAMRLLLDLGLDPNVQAETGRTALHGAAHKGRTAVIQLLVDHGAKVETRDFGMTGNDAGGRLFDHTWQAVDYADGLVRIATQSAVAHPEAGLLLRKLMTERGLATPPMGRTFDSVCFAPEVCADVKE